MSFHLNRLGSNTSQDSGVRRRLGAHRQGAFAQDTPSVDFERQVRPIFASKCQPMGYLHRSGILLSLGCGRMQFSKCWYDDEFSHPNS